MLGNNNHNVKTVTLGDLNVDSKNRSPSHAESLFLILFDPTVLKLLLINPLGLQSKIETCIDHIYTNVGSDVLSGVVNLKISDHCATFCSFNGYTRTPQNCTIRFREHSDVIIENVKCELSKKLSVFSAYESLSNNDHLNILHSLITQTYGKCCPVGKKIISVKRFMLPWLNDIFLRNIKEKQRLHRAFKNNTVSKSTYTSYCYSLNKAIFQAKRSYYEQRFSCCSNDPKETWKKN